MNYRRNSCNLWAKNGNCKFGNECKFRHSEEDHSDVMNASKSETNDGKNYFKVEESVRVKVVFTERFSVYDRIN